MSKNLVTEIRIDAPPRRVWEVLTDLAAYPQWNPFVVRADGTAEVGNRLTLRLQPVVGRATTVRPTVTAARPGAELRWLGRLGVRGVLDADHHFLLEPDGESGTRLVQQEHFGGLLVPLVARTLERGTLPAFVLMNEALKARAEQPVSSPRG
jgi:hypothetical protein